MATKKKTKVKKIHTLALSTGYAESASISVLLLKHEKGFLTMKEALQSLRTAVVAALHDDNCDIDLKGDNATYDDSVHRYVYELIHGDSQSHSEFWEYVTNQGWLMNGPWLGRNLKDIHYVERAEDLIAEPEEYNGQ